jgi:hypothetical protein
MLNRLWLSAAAGVGLILVWGLWGKAYAAATLTENGDDQTICDPTGDCLFTLPTGFPKFLVKFRSDKLGVGIASPDTEAGNELADLLTVTFPGETQKFASGERGQVLQNGFVNGGTVPLDTVTFVEPTTFRTFFSDSVGLFFDTANTKVAVTFASDIPEPSTWLLLATGFASLVGYGLRQRKHAT